MKIIDSYFEIKHGPQTLRPLEQIGRVCYKSEIDRVTEESADKFIRSLIKNGHESVLEHLTVTVQIVCDRGVSHELVRHRIASYTQESTRYCNYSKDKFNNEITFIRPYWVSSKVLKYTGDGPTSACGDLTRSETAWCAIMLCAEEAYKIMMAEAHTPQEARSILPNSLKTEIVMTMNFRQWRHFLKLRTANDVHPDMLKITKQLLVDFKDLWPSVFCDM